MTTRNQQSGLKQHHFTRNQKLLTKIDGLLSHVPVILQQKIIKVIKYQNLLMEYSFYKEMDRINMLQNSRLQLLMCILISERKNYSKEWELTQLQLLLSLMELLTKPISPPCFLIKKVFQIKTFLMKRQLFLAIQTQLLMIVMNQYILQ